jgi:hypothetical protein
MDIYATVLKEIAYVQLIPSICRANAYNYTNLVFAKACGTQFHCVSRLIICLAYANNM